MKKLYISLLQTLFLSKSVPILTAFPVKFSHDNIYYILFSGKSKDCEYLKKKKHDIVTLITRFTYSKMLKALVLNFRTAHRSVTRMYSAHSGIGRKRKLTLIITLIFTTYF